MGDQTIIKDLDSSLKLMLEKEIKDVSISFVTPDDKFLSTNQPSLPAIDLFLYDIRENRDRRYNEYTMERQPDGSIIKRPPSVRINCSYLVTAWSKNTNNPIEDEHYLLGRTMAVLVSNPKIPDDVLQGCLVDQEFPLPAISLQPSNLHSPSEFWQAMKGTPKATLHYTVTIGVRPSVNEVKAKPVTEKTIKIKQLHREGGNSGGY